MTLPQFIFTFFSPNFFYKILLHRHTHTKETIPKNRKKNFSDEEETKEKKLKNSLFENESFWRYADGAKDTLE